MMALAALLNSTGWFDGKHKGGKQFWLKAMENDPLL
jgi:hypothetical protein